MRIIRTIASSFLAILSISGPVAAADMAAHPPVITAESVMPDETGAGWYLRGDVGIANNVAPTLNWQSTSYNRRSAAVGGAFDFGVGYRFTENLRSDVTLDVLTNHRVKGYLDATDDDRLQQGSTALMVNGYYDIGTYSGITPYIGAGIGVARVNSDPLTRELNGTTTFVFAGTIHYSLAASATTGFSFDIGHGLQADIGYKFTWIDKTRTGTETSSTLQGPVNIGDSSSHQFRVGLKYFIN
jgi:opacity protein-like surface antigen